MANTKKNKLNVWVLAAAALFAPAIMSARTQAQPTQPAVSSVDQADQGDEADGASPPICAFYCNSSAQCTNSCQTEALCISHRCWPL
jgi:hypothetical protein